MIHIRVPGIPPSVNHVWSTGRHGIRFLKKEGKKYKAETKTHIARHFTQELKFFLPNRPYDILTEITFPERNELMCTTWPEEAKNRYKALDVSNRVKVFEDAFVEATAVDDSCTFIFAIGKRWEAGVAEMNLWAWCPEVEASPLHELLQQLRAARPQPH